MSIKIGGLTVIFVTAICMMAIYVGIENFAPKKFDSIGQKVDQPIADLGIEDRARIEKTDVDSPSYPSTDEGGNGNGYFPQGLASARDEIKDLDNDQLVAQLDELKSRIYDTDLIDRLNQGKVDEHELEDAAEIFDQAVLMGIEHAERELNEMMPEMEQAFAQAEDEIARIKEILADE